MIILNGKIERQMSGEISIHGRRLENILREHMGQFVTISITEESDAQDDGSRSEAG
jgi:hypothetical protein